MAPDKSQSVLLLHDLYEFMTDFYNLDELRALCFELGINFENLTGETRERKARGLVVQLGSVEEESEESCQSRYLKLLQILAEERPAFYAQLFNNLDTTQQGQESKEELLANYYCIGLDQFTKSTRPLQEKALSRFGLEQRVGTVSIILLLSLFGLAALLLWRQIRPDQMRGDFNIAVAPFQVNGADPEIGEDVANSIYGRLAGNFEGVGSPIVAVWGPGEPVLNPVPVIKGNNDDERDLIAAALSNEINADIVVYGVIENKDDQWDVKPKFYVSPNNFENATEILGPYDLGKAFGLSEGTRRALRITAGDELTPRSEFLTQVAIGLTYYSIANYERAAKTFTTVLENSEEAAAIDEESLRLVYLLLGNTSLKIALQEFDEFTSGANAENLGVMERMNIYLEEAETYFAQSSQIDPNYARPYLGLGDIAYLQSLECSGEGCRFTAEPLEVSISYYEQALASPNAPAAAVPDAKANLGLGQVYLRQSFIVGDKTFADAINYFNAVIDEYESGESPRARDLAAEAQARLGLIACRQGNTVEAINLYQTAIQLYTDDRLRTADHLFTRDVRDRRIEIYRQIIAQIETGDNPNC